MGCPRNPYRAFLATRLNVGAAMLIERFHGNANVERLTNCASGGGRSAEGLGCCKRGLCSPCFALPSTRHHRLPQLLPHHAAYDDLEGLRRTLHDSAQRLVDERLIVAASGRIDSSTEPIQEVRIQANRDPGLSLGNREDGAPTGLREIVVLTQGRSLPDRGGAHPGRLCGRRSAESPRRATSNELR